MPARRASRWERHYKRELLADSAAGSARIRTDPQASPTGFPFKIAQLEGTLSEPEVYQARARICDVGYLREAYRKDDGSIGYRCASEPVTIYVSKGGKVEETEGRKCLCNALLANMGLAQTRNGKHVEPGLVTAGDGLPGISRFLSPGATGYTAADVVSRLLAGGDPAGVHAYDLSEEIVLANA